MTITTAEATTGWTGATLDTGEAFSRPTVAPPAGVGHALTAYRMPIEGRDEWIAAVERLA